MCVCVCELHRAFTFNQIHNHLSCAIYAFDFICPQPIHIENIDTENVEILNGHNRIHCYNKKLETKHKKLG